MTSRKEFIREYRHCKKLMTKQTGPKPWEIRYSLFENLIRDILPGKLVEQFIDKVPTNLDINQYYDLAEIFMEIKEEYKS